MQASLKDLACHILALDLHLSSTSLLPPIKGSGQRQHFKGCGDKYSISAPVSSPAPVCSWALCPQDSRQTWAHLSLGQSWMIPMELHSYTLRSPLWSDCLWLPQINCRLSEAGTEAHISSHAPLNLAQCKVLNRGILIKVYGFIYISPLPLWICNL